MTIDKSGNIHRGSGTSGAGQFAGRVNSAPSESLTAASPSAASLDAFAVQRQAAESMYLSAKNTYFLANRDAAAVALREQFPWATEVVFSRSWDEPDDQIVIAQLIGPDRTIAIEEDDSAAEDQSKEQIAALDNARKWIAELGDRVTDYLDGDGEEHDGRDGYVLDLSRSPVLQNASAFTVDQLDESERDELYHLLSERDDRTRA